MARPIVGITTYLEAARWGTWVREAAVSPQAYARAVEKAGGAPVLLPPLSPVSAGDYVRRLDAVILAGGVEVDPALYGEVPAGEPDDDGLGGPQPQRDRFETALAQAAVEAEVPLLAISRGMHVLNVAQGGTLITSLPEAVGHDRHETAAHVVTVSVSSTVGKAVGDRAEVTGAHRRAVRRLGTGLIAVAWADDQIVEAVELQGHRFAVGVQWHPERGADNRLVEALVDAARP
ncbi:gamma-glutamyl-gamma-aminobutyrate hydrolase family protein [Microbispora sp. KK1-11]|uniref:gamma-glutamyl-gamma-aminobutyrate hydrolase family protein n=1 Tax=Microbispora sp. KK1-11 TaxID=2053005 RepID=UPI00115BC399|nr:gamma-glutamyl-gamma-aminobutyrate hydrolase family protein [Microbispora sp. KK1-11]TQS28523.1 gamma-glutamyl-gamma-aminobutyrate hydrolase family protein [Microbispora sp. KK1-11]